MKTSSLNREYIVIDTLIYMYKHKPAQKNNFGPRVELGEIRLKFFFTFQRSKFIRHFPSRKTVNAQCILQRKSSKF